MSKLQLLRVFLNERLTEAAVEIFGAFEKTVVEYQEENERLRRLLRITPDTKRCRIDSLQLSLAVSEEEAPPEQQHSDQEWRLSLGLEDLEPSLIKEEQQEPGTSQDEEQLKEIGINSIGVEFPRSCVKSECGQEHPLQSLTFPQTQTVENRESAFLPMDHIPFDTTTHLKGLALAYDPPDHLTNAFGNRTIISRDPVRLDNHPALDPNLLIGEHCSQPSTTSKTHRCPDCGETFALKADLQGHVTFAKKRQSECRLCKKRFSSTCKLKSHVQFCHLGKPYTCPFCGKIFKLKGHLPRHMRIHTGEKPFRCGDCGKRFVQKGDLSRHILTHTGEKPYSCIYCGKSFNRKDTLNLHMLTHTGENVHKMHN